MSELLPTGTVTLLLADVEGSTRLWETQPERMTAAIARLNQTVTDVITAHHGVRPVEQGEGDSFLVAFARASDAVACALQLQRSVLAPIRLRIGLHTGEIQLRGADNYAGTTINRTARLRDLAHGSQTVLSAITSDLVIDRLPEGAWTTDLGTHQLRDLPRPERIVQLCHPELRNDFPPLRTPRPVSAHNLPMQLTSFVGREAELARVRQLLSDERLVTLTGAGGVGKTRLAVQVAAVVADEFADGVWYVDLAPITEADVVPIAVARALGLADDPGRSTMDTLTRYVSGRHMLLVVDNCEHLLDASAALIVDLLAESSSLRLLATSREPIAVAGEMDWRVPPLALADEAIELFADRARHVRPDFAVTDTSAGVLSEICQRLDGLPLAIELAAARVRSLSLAEILDSLHDRFRLLTGRSRSAVRRQQTLRASVDWSHALLTESERMLFRQLAVFLGGFDLAAAQAVAGGAENYHVLDQLSLLVDKSLVAANDSGGRTRYRLLETVRQYAAEKLSECGEADAARARHRDHYTALVAVLDAPAGSDYERRLEQAEIEIDNLRAAFGCSREFADIESALGIVSSLQALWFTRGRMREGRAWFDAALTDLGAHHTQVAPAVQSRALADKAVLDAWMGDVDSLDQAEQALTIARELDEPALLARALTACGFCAGQRYNTALAQKYFAEAIGLARTLDDRWRLSQVLAWEAGAGAIAGDPSAVQAAGREGRDLADSIGDKFHSRQCRHWLGYAQMIQGDVAGAITELGRVVVEAEAAHDEISRVVSLGTQAIARAYQGEVAAARAAAEETLDGGLELGGRFAAFGYVVLGFASLAAGDAAAVHQTREAGRQHTTVVGTTVAVQRIWNVESALVDGDLSVARSLADEAVPTLSGWYSVWMLTLRARVAIATGEYGQAHRDARGALTLGAEIRSHLGIPNILECLAPLAVREDNHHEAARLFGAAHAIWQRIGAARFKVYDEGYQAAVSALREALGDKEFDRAWTEGRGLSTEEAIAYALRHTSLTPGIPPDQTSPAATVGRA
ncbi:NB-ARC domain-containing protein [Mycobacterium gordonae]|uniref:ATP-binding protein n=1 Tax=Mycobacterium gordonae TaxID=1778 RepID=UPI00210B87C6|nr:adenylate/guanylate cyclase domain-containing protein [Mycobacterium gordonae]MCQ4360474.1 NB-ARC domain-containing protein [Mycobacterium gordonae]